MGQNLLMFVLMAFSPLVARELRVEARRPWNYWARTAAGALVTISFALGTLSASMSAVSGAQLFGQATFLVGALIWIVAPLLTADCLSREKREGTLGLLFLTPLRSAGIVVGKSLVHALRASSVLFAAVPVLAIALVFGGVSGRMVVLALLHFLGALAVALSAGLLASAWTRDWIRAVILAVLFAVLFGSIYQRAASFVLGWQSLSAAGFVFLFSVLLLAGVIGLVALRIRQTWQEAPASPYTRWWLQTFCSPLVWKERFRASMRRSLERNPVGWLYERTTTARLSKWMWCLGAVLLDCALTGGAGFVPWGRSYVGFEMALLLAMAFAGAASFRRERQNGMFELLLVAPLAFEAIIQGRLGALRKQFLPAVLLIILPFVLFSLWAGPDVDPFRRILFPQLLLLATSLVSLPKLGLYLSFRQERFLTIWLLTCLIGVVAPYFLAWTLVSPTPRGDATFGMMAIIQFGLCHFAVGLLRDGLGRQALARQLTR